MNRNKIFLWSIGAAGVLLAAALIIGQFRLDSGNENVELAMKQGAETYEKQRLVDSAVKAAHEARMQSDKPYRDSVRKAEALAAEAQKEAEARALEENKLNEPWKYIEVDFKWRKSGFGAVAMGDFTITNNSAIDLKDPQVEVTFYGESGTVLGTKTETLTIIAKAGKKARAKGVNLGFIKSQTTNAGVKFVSATWGG